MPRPGPPSGVPPRRGERIGRPEALLALWGALLWAAEHGPPTAWSPREWERFVRDLTPQEIVTLAFRSIRGMTLLAVGKWLGVSRARAGQCVQSIERKLAKTAAEMYQTQRSL